MDQFPTDREYTYTVEIPMLGQAVEYPLCVCRTIEAAVAVSTCLLVCDAIGPDFVKIQRRAVVKPIE